ncbi:HupE/UreJ family protein [Sinorhizobium chiapasense]|uniref:HupE/UreJ family protein n=1 Tax=Sinorhizobium chiapasense TaxID=501572 RepID=A0ABZ2BFP5_9HYPH
MRVFLAICFTLFASSAFAHTGVGSASGVIHGFLHPLSGIDHILAMIAVGILAANLGGRAIWAVPLTFMALMGVGGFLGIAHVPLPFIELGIALSIIVLGLAVAAQWDWPIAAAMALVGVFAIFHGHAHGAEMPVDPAGLAYALGFMLAAGHLHLIGIGIGIGAARLASTRSHAQRLTQFGGAAIAVLGGGVLVGLV